MSNRKCEDTARIEVVDSNGTRLAVIESTEYLEVTYTSGPKWEVTRHSYRLQDGTEVDLKKDGSFEVPSSSRKLTRV